MIRPDSSIGRRFARNANKERPGFQFRIQFGYFAMKEKTFRLASLSDAIEKIFHEMIIEFEEHHPRIYIHLTWKLESQEASSSIEFPEGEYLYVNVQYPNIVDFINAITTPEEKILSSMIKVICFDSERKHPHELARFVISKPVYESATVLLERSD